MMVSTKGRYALRIMIDLAENGQNSPVSLKDIAEREDIGIKYLEIIVASLNKNGLLESVRGKNGGYKLNKRPEEYSISSILNAAEGSLAPVACVETDSCENAHCCKTYTLWKELDDVIENFLSSKTLADII
ncbi:MAG: RrF2 family transcriptional regulator [Eubacteriales bacterium]|nr:RrF2 family transcriptional regulator [Eubacteriales bacterium]